MEPEQTVTVDLNVPAPMRDGTVLPWPGGRPSDMHATTTS